MHACTNETLFIANLQDLIPILATPKQINLTSVFVTTAALSCQCVILLTSGCKSAQAQCRQAAVNRHLHNTEVIIFSTSTKSFKKTN